MAAPFREQHEAICRRVGQARQASGMTREGFAQNLTACSGVVVSTRDARRFERSRVPWAQLDEIARLTGTTRSWLLYGDSELRAAEAPEELWASSIWDDPAPFWSAPASANGPDSRGRPSIPTRRILRGILLGVPLALGVQAVTGRPAFGGLVLALAVGASLLRESPGRGPTARRGL